MGLIKKIKNSIPQEYKNIYHLAIAVLAVLRFGYPARGLKVLGVTGTDGKTTTTTLIYQILKISGKKVALISTVAAYIGNKELDTGFHVTAPDPWMLQKLLRKIKDMKFDYVVLEATSHGLDQHRLLGTNVKTAVLTNITHEHLDYHKTYDRYVKAKAKLFKNAEIAILNKSDKSFSIIRKLIPSGVKIIAYDLNSPSAMVKNAINSRFPEIYNQLNAVAAYLAARNEDVKDAQAVKAIKSFTEIPGRMYEIKNSKNFRTIVDFAHTPNALEKVLEALSKQKAKDQRLIAVFGCASERDDAKRPMMGEISGRLADVSIFTAEDSRYEDINKILSEMEVGAKKAGAYEVKPENYSHKNFKKNIYFKITERGEAISFAVNKIAQNGDIVVACGKGHEKSMSYFGTEYPWSDKKAFELALSGKVLKINHK